jgi:hypothetical protein
MRIFPFERLRKNIVSTCLAYRRLINAHYRCVYKSFPIKYIGSIIIAASYFAVAGSKSIRETNPAL